MSRFILTVPRLLVTDLRRSIAFYIEVLGFELGSTWPDDTPTFAILERDAVQLQLSVRESLPDGVDRDALLSFTVSDARAVFAALGGDVPIAWGPEVYSYGRREFAILDPDGYMLIISEVTDDEPTCIVD